MDRYEDERAAQEAYGRQQKGRVERLEEIAEMEECVIHQLKRKVAAGERRAGRLEEQLMTGSVSEGARAFVKEELAFIYAGLMALKFHEAWLRPETSVPKALQDLLDELNRLGYPGQGEYHDRLSRAMTHARRVLGDLDLWRKK